MGNGIKPAGDNNLPDSIRFHAKLPHAAATVCLCSLLILIKKMCGLKTLGIYSTWCGWGANAHGVKLTFYKRINVIWQLKL